MPDPASDFQEIRYERRGAGGYIALNRPERRNALNISMVREIWQALDRAEGDEEVHACVITGSDQVFCAGAHLKHILAAMRDDPRSPVSEEYLWSFLRPTWRCLARLREFPKPVIAAVNGVCAAGGLEMILCCDLIVAAESATFSDAHARYGLLPAVGGAAGLVRSVGPYRAKEMMFLAEFHSAADMADAGLVNRVVPDPELDAHVAGLVDTLARRSPSGLRRMKQMVNEGSDLPWLDAARTDFLHVEAAWGSPDFVEGLRAFSERREPQFARPGPDVSGDTDASQPATT